MDSEEKEKEIEIRLKRTTEEQNYSGAYVHVLSGACCIWSVPSRRQHPTTLPAQHPGSEFHLTHFTQEVPHLSLLLLLLFCLLLVVFCPSLSPRNSCPKFSQGCGDVTVEDM